MFNPMITHMGWFENRITPSKSSCPIEMVSTWSAIGTTPCAGLKRQQSLIPMSKN